jgi:hypothetical protein
VTSFRAFITRFGQLPRTVTKIRQFAIDRSGLGVGVVGLAECDVDL